MIEYEGDDDFSIEDGTYSLGDGTYGGINDLIKRYRAGPDCGWDSHSCADHIEALAEVAWHPVSEPPTEADYQTPAAPMPKPWILVRDGWGTWGPVTKAQFEDVVNDPELADGEFYTHWARPRDVVLMPPGTPE